MPFSCETFDWCSDTGLQHRPFLFQPVETELFSAQGGSLLPVRFLKFSGNTTLIWSIKLLSRTGVPHQTLHLG